MKTCLIVFAKNPVPNQVKTRLIPTLSPEQAATLYAAFLTDWCEALVELADVDLVIAYTPADAQLDLQTLIGDDVIYIPQMGTDLGERLTSATQWATEQGYAKILFVGSDSPTLPISYISQAITLLDSRDTVIGPSTDGGYYLIGFSVETLATTIPQVFEEIAWSTAEVFQQTVTRIREAKVTLGLLPPWYDIDTPEDLTFLHTHISATRLAGDRVQAVRTESLLAELRVLLT
ncbi:TIGR04282 family arsenosugar biosynthesis glycosyltransferase [Candidatus Poribacteria bacterium]|nr:TIGR04282 family arsenosugar biosynthesis glycosyltransferase [Candidatus Poribacteria bacterium]